MQFTFDLARSPDRFNALANSERLKPWVAEHGMGEIDLSRIWDYCVGLEWPEGGFVFQQLDDCGLWEIHTLFEHSHRAAMRAREALHFMFVRKVCDKIVTRVPDNNKHALKYAQCGGMRDLYISKKIWKTAEGKVDVHCLSLRTEQWIADNADLEKIGQEFHDYLSRTEFHTDHEDDPVHDCFVGYVAECYRHGVPHRGIFYYNRWAIATGYKPIEFIDAQTAGFDDVLVKVLPIGYEVTLCQSEA